MSRSETLFIDVDCAQKCKTGQQICGDAFVSKRLEEQEEEERKKEKRRRDFYNEKMLKRGGERKKNNIYIFTQEDLDNDDIISMVETTPTYKRTQAELKSIQSKAYMEEKDIPAENTAGESSDPRVIDF